MCSVMIYKSFLRAHVIHFIKWSNLVHFKTHELGVRWIQVGSLAFSPLLARCPGAC